jgi:uncharacterized protein (TIGR02466 family)
MTTLISTFSTALYHTNIPVDINFQEEIKNLEYLRVKHDNGYISANYHLLDIADFINIKKIIMDNARTYVFDILRVRNSYRLHMATSWANKHDTDDYSQEHAHNNSIISGIYYIDVENTSGNLIFSNPTPNFGSTFELNLQDHNQFNSNEAIILPKNGDLFLFPSSLKHKVEKNKSPNQRYSIAFNIMINGMYGMHEKELLI